MPLALELHGEIQGGIGKAGPQRRVWSAAIVMRQPRPHSFSKMVLGQGDNPIQTLASERPDQPFAERICLRAPLRCCDDFKAHVRYRSIESGGEDRVAIMKDKPVSVV